MSHATILIVENRRLFTQFKKRLSSGRQTLQFAPDLVRASSQFEVWNPWLMVLPIDLPHAELLPLVQHARRCQTSILGLARDGGLASVEWADRVVPYTDTEQAIRAASELLLQRTRRPGPGEFVEEATVVQAMDVLFPPPDDHDMTHEEPTVGFTPIPALLRRSAMPEEVTAVEAHHEPHADPDTAEALDPVRELLLLQQGQQGLERQMLALRGEAEEAATLARELEAAQRDLAGQLHSGQEQQAALLASLCQRLQVMDQYKAPAKQLEQTRHELEQQRGRLHTLEVELERSRQSLQGDLEQQEVQANALHDRLNRLSHDLPGWLDQLRRELEPRQEETAEVERARARYDDHATTIATLQRQLEQLDRIKAQARDLEQTRQELSRGTDELSQRLGQGQEALRQQLEQLRQGRVELLAQVEQQASALVTVDRRLGQLDRIKAPVDAVEQARRELELLQQSLEQIRDELSRKLGLTQEVLGQQLVEAQQARAELAQQVEQQATTLAAVDRRLGQLDRSKAPQELLSQTRKELEQARGDLEQRLVQAQELSIRQLEGERQARTELTKQVEQQAAVMSVVDRRLGQLDRVKATEEALQQTRDELQQGRTELQRELELLQQAATQQLEQVQLRQGRQLAAAERRLAAVEQGKAEAADLEQSRKELAQGRQELEQTLFAAGQELEQQLYQVRDTASERLDHLARQLEQLEQDKASDEELARELEQIRTDLAARLDTAREELSLLREELTHQVGGARHDLEQQLEQWSGRLSARTDDLEQEQERLARDKAGAADLTRVQTDLEQALAAAGAQLQERAAFHDRQLEQLDRTKASARDLTRTDAGLEQAREELTRITADLDRARQLQDSVRQELEQKIELGQQELGLRLEQARAIIDERAAFQDKQLTQLDRAKATTRELAQARQELEQTRQQLEQLDATLGTARQELWAQLQTSAEELGRQLSQARADLEQRNGELELKLTRLHDDVVHHGEEQRLQLDQARQNLSRQLEQQRSTLQHSIDEHHTLLEQTRHEMSQRFGLAQQEFGHQLQRAEEDRGRLQRRIEDTATGLGQQLSDLDHGLSGQLSETRQTLEQQQEQARDELNQRVDQARDELNRQLEHTGATLQAAVDEHATWLGQMERDKATAAALSQTQQQLEQALASTRTRLEQALEQAVLQTQQQLGQTQESLQQKLDDAAGLTAALLQQAEQARTGLSQRLERQTEAASTRHQQLEDSVVELRGDMAQQGRAFNQRVEQLLEPGRVLAQLGRRMLAWPYVLILAGLLGMLLASIGGLYLLFRSPLSPGGLSGEEARPGAERSAQNVTAPAVSHPGPTTAPKTPPPPLAPTLTKAPPLSATSPESPPAPSPLPSHVVEPRPLGRPLGPRQRRARARMLARAQLLSRRADRTEAQKLLVAALALADDVAVRRLLSASHERAGELAAAAYHLERAIPVAPQRQVPLLYDDLGLLQIKAGNRDQACLALSTARKLAPRLAAVRRHWDQHCR